MCGTNSEIRSLVSSKEGDLEKDIYLLEMVDGCIVLFGKGLAREDLLFSCSFPYSNIYNSNSVHVLCIIIWSSTGSCIHLHIQ